MQLRVNLADNLISNIFNCVVLNALLIEMITFLLTWVKCVIKKILK